ncbi:acid protease [Hyaloscypha variabilis]
MYGVVEVGIGSPTTIYALRLDTGAATTCVGNMKPYVKTPTSLDTGNAVAIKGKAARFSIEEYLDALFVDGIGIIQSIEVATQSSGYGNMDGMLGLRPKTKEFITVSDNLFNRRNINSDIVTISKDSVAFGSQLLQVANIIYGPFTTKSPANKYWGIDASLSYDGAAVISLTAVIIYHGDTPIALNTNSYIQLLAVTGALLDATTGYPAQVNCDGLSPLTLDFAGIVFNIPFDIYRWPGSENAAIGGNPSKRYLAVQDLRTPYGSGLGSSLGWNTLKYLTVVLNTTNSQVRISTIEIEI